MTTKNKQGEDFAKDTFTLKNGKVIQLRAISPYLIDQLYAGQDEIKPPTYEAKTASGDVEVHPHDETTLDTDEDKKLWQEYIEKKEAQDNAFNEKMQQVLFLRGMDVSLPETDDWVEEQAFFGIDVPEKKIERRLHYITTEIIQSPSDLATIIGRIMALSGVDQKLIKTIDDSFRDSVSRITTEDAKDK